MDRAVRVVDQQLPDRLEPLARQDPLALDVLLRLEPGELLPAPGVGLVDVEVRAEEVLRPDAVALVARRVRFGGPAARRSVRSQAARSAYAAAASSGGRGQLRLQASRRAMPVGARRRACRTSRRRCRCRPTSRTGRRPRAPGVARRVARSRGRAPATRGSRPSRPARPRDARRCSPRPRAWTCP